MPYLCPLKMDWYFKSKFRLDSEICMQIVKYVCEYMLI